VTGAPQRFQGGDAFDTNRAWAAGRLFVAVQPAAAALVAGSRAWQVKSDDKVANRDTKVWHGATEKMVLE
jgi:hypothetical protein